MTNKTNNLISYINICLKFSIFQWNFKNATKVLGTFSMQHFMSIVGNDVNDGTQLVAPTLCSPHKLTSIVIIGLSIHVHLFCFNLKY